MLIPNQNVEIKWNHKNKKWYISKGYNFTDYGDSFLINIKDIMPSAKTEVDVECDYCGEIFKMPMYRYTTNISKNIKKIACQKCAGKKLSDSIYIKNQGMRKQKYDEFISICKNNEYIPISTTCENESSFLLEYICPIHGKEKSTLFYLRENGCPECKKSRNLLHFKEKRLREFEELCNEMGYVSLAKVDDCTSWESKLPFLCQKHGIKYTNLRNMKFRGDGCNECGYIKRTNKIKLTQDDVRREIESKNSNKWKNYGEYKNAITNNLEVICGSCFNVFLTSQNNYARNITGKCPECNVQSYGEYIILSFLKDNNIKYTTQESFNGDCRDKNPLKFDFYLPDYNLCIEFDGAHHYRPVWGDDHFISTLLHDGMKNNYCRWNNIDLLRIPYWESKNINTILADYLGIEFCKIKYVPSAQRKAQKNKKQVA